MHNACSLGRAADPLSAGYQQLGVPDASQEPVLMTTPRHRYRHRYRHRHRYRYHLAD